MNKLILIVLSLVLPPLAVFLKDGIGKQFWINILLCFLAYFPGIVHAIWRVTK